MPKNSDLQGGLFANEADLPKESNKPRTPIFRHNFVRSGVEEVAARPLAQLQAENEKRATANETQEAHFEVQSSETDFSVPLSARMRPRTLDEYVGQKHLVGPGRVLRRLLESGSLP